MKQVKFRGLSKAGVWVYGDLIQTKPNKVNGDFTCWIKERGFLGLGAVSTPTAAFIEVETKTVGQLTGLTDKNGIEIYEGDILSTDLSRPYLVVEFLGGAFMYQCHDSGDDYYDHMSPTCDIRTQDKYCAVIGNVHQNPELLEQNK